MSIRHNAVTHAIRPRRRRSGGRKLLIPVIIAGVCVFGIALMTVYYYSEQTYLVLNGEDRVSVGLQGIYEDPGVTAKSWGRDVSDQAEVSGLPDTRTPGDYVVTYTSGDLHVERTVTVMDHMVPQLELKGDKTITMKLGETYEEPGYTAADDNGNDLTDQVKVSDQQFNRAGTFKIRYTVSDSEGRKTRLARKVTIEPNTEYETPGLPICMYHYVYDENDPPDDVNSRYKNYISKQDLIEEMNWLNEEGYYYPAWEEVRDYVDGKLLLPEKSIVLTFDDGEYATLDQLLPIVEETHVPVTSFLITEHAGEKKVKNYKSKYLRFESHTHGLHHAGGAAGFRGMLPVIDYETGLADLKKSIEICGSGLAIAYPYGDYNENVRTITEAAGFLIGVTTQFGNARPGMNPLALPRVRMWQDQTMDYFQRNVAPPNTLQPAGQ
ncbi:MAG: DUF5011 domain-containing protein [Firmicutes bacterium]|nr:DUF5011 domain-containing protein [Bacillota bacterium]